MDEIIDDDFKMIKFKLFMEGPLLAVLQSKMKYFIIV